MLKWIVFGVLACLLAGCRLSDIADQVRATSRVEATGTVEATRPVETARPVEVTRQVEITRQVEVTRLVTAAAQAAGPWTVQKSITRTGEYLVPEEMQPGEWFYQANDPEDTCAAFIYSDLTGSTASLIDIFMSQNKGYFVLPRTARLVKLQLGPCTWTRIGS